MDLFGKNNSMIIFLIIVLLLLLITLNVHIVVHLKNQYVEYKISFLIFKIEKNKKLFGSVKKKNSLKVMIRNELIKSMNYSRLIISEEIGLFNPIITAIALPAVATLTIIPLYYLKIDCSKFRYRIIPQYNKFTFVLDIDILANIRVINVIFSIFRIIMHKLYMSFKMKNKVEVLL